ncbi:MAG: hypothetical protein E6I21_00215 [Chloroflexi bacterium]|nr:MAG: hypothetical protein E6I21_00215 [Chloroflexota bacterium]
MPVRVLVLSLLLFMVGFGAHEVMHLLLIYAVGADGSIIARPWRLGYVDFTIYALHAQPSHPLDVVRQAVVNFFGPFLAAIPLAGLLLYVREPIPFAALVANVLILVFYAVIELADLLLESVWHVDVPLLTTPEFNYGVPLLVIVVTTLALAILLRVRGRPIPE